MNQFFIFALALLLGLCTEAVRAHGGEDHGPPAVVNARPLLPRVTAHSELFELIGVLEPGGRLLLWLDATPTNAPVEGAVVEVEGAAANGKAAEVSPGVYELKLAQVLAPGSHPLTFTVQAGSDMDLLGAPLVVAQGAEGSGQGAAVVAGEASSRTAWAGPAGWMALGAVGMGVAMAGVSALRRRALAARR